MKEKLTRNIGLKILAIILAVILWLVITNVDDPITKVNFSNIKVDVQNADEIKALNQVYNITEGATIDFTAAAKRSVAEKLNKDDFRITADISKLSDLNTVTINIKYLGNPYDVTVISGLNQVMKVELENLVEGHFKVNVEQTGDLAEGLYVYEKTASTIIRISGPKSKIDKIANVVVNVDVTGYTKSFNSIEEPKVLDEKGKEIDSTNLSFSKNSIPVFIGIYNTKTINLDITPTGTPVSGYTLSGIEYEPQTIEVAAEDEVLAGIDDLSISEDVSGVFDNVEKEVNLQEQLPSGVYLVGDNKTAVVNISVEEAKTKEFTVLPSEIDVKNLPKGMGLDYLTTGPITLLLSGPKKEIDEISKDDIKPYIDLTNYSVGTYSVIIGSEITGYSKLGNVPSVNIHLIKQ
jgi:YbbR domain-containing protein